GSDHHTAPPRGCGAKRLEHVQRHSGNPHPGRFAGTPPDIGWTHSPHADPRHQRHRPECRPQSRALDAGRGDAALERELTPSATGPPTPAALPLPAIKEAEKIAPIRRCGSAVPPCPSTWPRSPGCARLAKQQLDRKGGG